MRCTRAPMSRISGGTLTLATGDDGVHADNDLVIGAKGCVLDEYAAHQHHRKL